MTQLAPLVLVLAAAALPACVSHPGTAERTEIADLRGEEGWILLDGVRFVPQQSGRDCGAAALAMVLGHWGAEVPVETLAAECADGGTEGLRATALRDAARRRGLAAYLFAGRVSDLEHELRRGRPVVVGLVRQQAGLASSHYVVVVGLDPEGAQVAALDPARGPVRDSLAAFEGEWKLAQAATLVVFRREQAPAATAERGP